MQKVVKIANPRFYQQNVARPHGLAKGVHCLCGLSRCRKLKAAGSQRLHPPNRGSLHLLRSYLLFKGSRILNPKNYCSKITDHQPQKLLPKFKNWAPAMSRSFHHCPILQLKPSLHRHHQLHSLHPDPYQHLHLQA